MNDPGVTATFCDTRIIAGRKVMKLILEVPIEMRNVALERLGGVPDPANPGWVMVVPFDPAKNSENKG